MSISEQTQLSNGNMSEQPISRTDVTLIIVTYNSAHCIDPLAECIAGMPNVVFVDNGSSDGTAEKIRQKMPSASLLTNSSNLGFGAANNRALQICPTRYALLLNPDCLLEPGAVDRLLKNAATYPNAAVIAPHLFRRNDSLELSYRWPATYWKSSGPSTEGPCCVGFVSGAVMLLNMAVMRDIGFFDERFFLYYEDEDLCQRVFLAGKEIIVVPDAKITHISRGSVKGSHPLRSEFIRGYHHAQSKLIFEGKHVGEWEAIRLRWKTLALALLTLFPRVLLPQPKYIARLVGRIAGLCAYAPRGNRPIR